MVQSVIQWGKNPVVVIKQQDDHVKSVKKSKPQNAREGSTNRESRQDAKDDRLLIKKLKKDDARVSFQADQVEETPAVSSDMPSAVTDVPRAANNFPAGAGQIVQSNVFWLGHIPFLAGQTSIIIVLNP